VFFVLVDGWNLVCGSLIKSFQMDANNLTGTLPTEILDSVPTEQ